MISQEKFNEIESNYGCGYWNVCWEHACPCAIITEHKGLQEDIYIGLLDEAQKVADSFEEDNDDYFEHDEINYEDEFDDYWNDIR